MFDKNIKFVFIFLFAVSSLMASLAFPSQVLADDGVPPSDPAPEAGVSNADESAVIDQVISEDSVVELLQVMDEAGVVLTDENGDVLPLVSEEALDLLTVPDPYIVRSGVTYRFLPVGGCAAFPGDPNCTESATPIQAAIDFSANGETIFVDPGTYVEQLVINKDIILQATAPGAIIKSPDTLTNFFMSGSNHNYPVVYVHDTANASIIGFVIDGDNNGDGNYRFDGVGYYNAGGTIQNNTIQNIMNSSFSGAQHGVGIFVYAPNGNPYNVVIDGNVIEDYQKNGMTISGSGVTAEITDNIVTGAGPTSVTAQNGIQVSGGADALIQGNTVTGNVYIPDTTVSTGILFFGPGDVEISDNNLDGNDMNAYVTGAGTVEVTGNTISNGLWNGLWVDNSGLTTITDNSFTGNTEGIGLDSMLNMPGVEISGNVFTGNTLAIANYDTVDVDATGNFWGCPTGPDDPTCDPVSDYVIYDPWLDEDPFIVVPPVVNDKNHVNRVQVTPPFIIPVTGELTEISCETESSTLLAGEVKVTLAGLCGYQIMLEVLTNEVLPAKLDNGDTLLFGLNINLFKNGTLIDELPADASIVISFPSTGSAMKLNSSVNAWQEIKGKDIDGQFEVDAGPGTFVLVGR